VYLLKYKNYDGNSNREIRAVGELRLTLAKTGLALTIPARTVRLREEYVPGQVLDCEDALMKITFRIGNQMRTRVLSNTYEEVAKMLAEDKSCRKDWFETHLQGGQAYAFFPSDVVAVEDLDPEVVENSACLAMVDLTLDGDEAFTLVGIKVKADPAEIREAQNPTESFPMAVKKSAIRRNIQ
jgi:hypothetical protein